MSKCKCSLSISLCGDGCRYCQPQEYIDRLHEILEEERAEQAQLEKQHDELQRQNAYLCEQLNDAAESVQEWGNYADSYFQDKWNLDGDVQKYKDAANSTSAIPTKKD